MWFNSTIPGAPYPPQWRPPAPLMREGGGAHRGAAWLSSVRAVRRGLGWPNERNPRGAAPGASRPVPGPPGLASPGPTWVTGRGCGGSQVNMAYIGWATHVPQGPPQRAASAKAAANPQSGPQFGLRAASRAHEAETVSNRASGCHGEARSGSAHTAHHARKVWPAGGPPPLGRGGGRDRGPGDLSEVDTR